MELHTQLAHHFTERLTFAVFLFAGFVLWLALGVLADRGLALLSVSVFASGMTWRALFNESFFAPQPYGLAFYWCYLSTTIFMFVRLLWVLW